jgi:hypothetical protein
MAKEFARRMDVDDATVGERVLYGAGDVVGGQKQ